MSVTPVTPTTSITRHTVSTLKKQKCKYYENEHTGIFAGTTDSSSSDMLLPTLTEVMKKVLKDMFGKDSMWYGSQVFTHVTSQASCFLEQANICLWLVFVTAFDHFSKDGASGQFHGKAQLAICPSSLDRFLASRKTHHFLMTFDKGNLVKILHKFPEAGSS
ncbi:hypothetical protein JVU11DRAFT_11753 [Chiua virens]|nr:hypothetical protein JVU11DRAFT_11753 [Chiua virens]